MLNVADTVRARAQVKDVESEYKRDFIGAAEYFVSLPSSKVKALHEATYELLPRWRRSSAELLEDESPLCVLISANCADWFGSDAPCIGDDWMIRTPALPSARSEVLWHDPRMIHRERLPLPEPSASDDVLKQTFHELAERWQEESAAMSSVTQMCGMNQTYQRIIGMGPRVVPLILRELERKPDHWFWALTAITGENPVSPEDAGDVDKMREAWLDFGERRGYL